MKRGETSCKVDAMYRKRIAYRGKIHPIKKFFIRDLKNQPVNMLLCEAQGKKKMPGSPRHLVCVFPLSYDNNTRPKCLSLFRYQE